MKTYNKMKKNLNTLINKIELTPPKLVHGFLILCAITGVILKVTSNIH